MAKVAAKPVKPTIGEVVTIEVAIPHDGLEKGYKRDIKYSGRVEYMIENGYWKIVK